MEADGNILMVGSTGLDVVLDMEVIRERSQEWFAGFSDTSFNLKTNLEVGDYIFIL